MLLKVDGSQESRQRMKNTWPEAKGVLGKYCEKSGFRSQKKSLRVSLNNETPLMFCT